MSEIKDDSSDRSAVQAAGRSNKNTGEVEHVPTWEKFDHSHMVITSKW